MSKIIPESDLTITGTPKAYIWSFTSKKYKKYAILILARVHLLV
ncbi:hypothetical protein [Metallosphaera tengchongensis]|nr:hypothetical protein [Metallosphaera tengchongensis]